MYILCVLSKDDAISWHHANPCPDLTVWLSSHNIRPFKIVQITVRNVVLLNYCNLWPWCVE